MDKTEIVDCCAIAQMLDQISWGDSSPFYGIMSYRCFNFLYGKRLKFWRRVSIFVEYLLKGEKKINLENGGYIKISRNFGYW